MQIAGGARLLDKQVGLRRLDGIWQRRAMEWSSGPCRFRPKQSRSRQSTGCQAKLEQSRPKQRTEVAEEGSAYNPAPPPGSGVVFLAVGGGGDLAVASLAEVEGPLKGEVAAFRWCEVEERGVKEGLRGHGPAPPLRGKGIWERRVRSHPTRIPCRRLVRLRRQPGISTSAPRGISVSIRYLRLDLSNDFDFDLASR